MGLDGWSLVACVVFAGLWSGLLAMLTLVMHRMLARMSGGDLARFLRAFLPSARKAPFNYIEVAGMVVAPIVALVALGTSADAAFWLTCAGLAVTIAGPLLVSNRLAEPNYDVILAWDPDAMPATWQATRHRYFTYNWIRFATTSVAFALFLAALVEHLQ